jgi:hypothetical protein
VKRPILGLLAAAIMSLGLLGPSSVRAATSDSPTTTAAVTPAHDNGDEHGHKYSHRYGQGGTRHHDHDWDDGDGHDGRRGRCSGLIVVCLG